MNTHVEGKFGGVNKFLPFLSFSRSVKFLELDIERIYSLFDWMSHVRGKLREWVLTSPSLFFFFSWKYQAFRTYSAFDSGGYYVVSSKRFFYDYCGQIVDICWELIIELCVL